MKEVIIVSNIVIVGAGPAGMSAAKAAVKSGNKVILAGDEPYLPYWRPRLPEIIRTGASVDTILMQKKDWFLSNGIQFVPSKQVCGIDPSKKSILWEDGSSTEYSALILSCGANSRIPNVPFAEKVYPLRTYENAMDIRRECMCKHHAFIIGGGILGLETAYAITQLGIPVCVYDNQDYPLSRQLDREGGLFLKKQLEAKDILVRSGPAPEAFRDDIEKSCVIAAAGVLPSIELAKKCGINMSRGILVDDHMKTSVQDIYACGDAAEFSGTIPGLMSVAAKQGEVAGLNAAGGNAVYRAVLPSPMTKIAGISILSIGSINDVEGGQVYRRSNGADYAMAVVSSGKIIGAALIGSIASGTQLKELIENGTDIGDITSYEDIEKVLDHHERL